MLIFFESDQAGSKVFSMKYERVLFGANETSVNQMEIGWE